MGHSRHSDTADHGRLPGAGVRLVRGLHNAHPHGGCALTIGNFDGVHRGHAALLAQLVAAARERSLAPALLTFEPHPVELLAPERAPARLTDFRQKISLLARHALDRVVCARFDRRLAAMSADDFIHDVLVRRLGVRHLLVGDDFRFGHRGGGDFATLRAAADAGHFTLSRLDTQHDGARRISSTRVRECLAAGDLSGAAALLGRPYSLCGRVAHGQRLGRRIGFPTANLPLRRGRAALAGVYAVHLLDGGGTRLEGVANVGRRPTVDGTEERVEVHVLDFDGDLYGRLCEVRFLARLREEQRFAGLDALRAQIARDVEAGRRVLAAHRAGAGTAGP